MSQLALATSEPPLAMDVLHPSTEDTNTITFSSFLCVNSTNPINRPPHAISPRIVGRSPRLPSALPPSASPRCFDPATPDKHQSAIPFFSNDDSIELHRPADSDIRERERARRFMFQPTPSPGPQPSLSPDVFSMYRNTNPIEILPNFADSPTPSVANSQIELAPLRAQAAAGLDPFARASPSPSAFKPPPAPSSAQPQNPVPRDFFREPFVSPRPDDPMFFDKPTNPPSVQIRQHSDTPNIQTLTAAQTLPHTVSAVPNPVKMDIPMPELPTLAIPTLPPNDFQQQQHHPSLTHVQVAQHNVTRPPRPPTGTTPSPPALGLPNHLTSVQTKPPPPPPHMRSVPVQPVPVMAPAPVVGPIDNTNLAAMARLRKRPSNQTSSSLEGLDPKNEALCKAEDMMPENPPSTPPSMTTVRDESSSPSASPSRSFSKTPGNSNMSMASLPSTSSQVLLPRSNRQSLRVSQTRKLLSKSTSDVDPLLCTTCNHKFARRSNLYKHLRSVHQHERKFACNQCTLKFKRRDHLLKHVRSVHIKEKKYLCGICGIGFAEKFNRDKHCRSIHETKRAFQCPCGAYFQDRDRMINCLKCKQGIGM